LVIAAAISAIATSTLLFYSHKNQEPLEDTAVTPEDGISIEPKSDVQTLNLSEDSDSEPE